MKLNKHVLFVVVLIACVTPNVSLAAADDLTVSGWIPYWNDSRGIKDATAHLDSLDTIYPFAYTVKSNGTIADLANLTDREWKTFMKKSRASGVEIIPTIMSGDGEQIDQILRDANLRKNHINAIVSMVEKGKYDGVDIDYEGKKAGTSPFFSIFLLELKQKLGSKILSCTIEARTPPESLYVEVPSVITYSNDYNFINFACDRVVIMAYDQQRADLDANGEHADAPYIPVADPLWIEKVVKLALKSFPKEKIVLGIPSYGHHWSLAVSPYRYRQYIKIGALNMPDMLDLAKERGVTPSRNDAGEMSFTYLPKATPTSLVKSIMKMSIPKDTPKGNAVAARALAYANKTGAEVVVNVGWYSDANAMIDKIELAKKYGLSGISFFKIDGEEDQKVWTYLAE